MGYIPAFQLGLVKESKKSVFLFGAKPQMSRTYITSSNVINRCEEVRWDDLSKKSVVDGMCLGVELRIWGWFPEALQHCQDLLDDEERSSEMKETKTKNDNLFPSIAKVDEEEQKNSSYNNNHQDKNNIEEQQQQQQHQESKI